MNDYERYRRRLQRRDRVAAVLAWGIVLLGGALGLFVMYMFVVLFTTAFCGAVQ